MAWSICKVLQISSKLVIVIPWSILRQNKEPCVKFLNLWPNIVVLQSNNIFFFLFHRFYPITIHTMTWLLYISIIRSIHSVQSVRLHKFCFIISQKEETRRLVHFQMTSWGDAKRHMKIDTLLQLRTNVNSITFGDAAPIIIHSGYVNHFSKSFEGLVNK